MKPRSLIFIVCITVLVLATYMSTFVLYEGRQAIITQFGKPIRTVNLAGLHFKIPVLQDVRRIDMRILNWDGFPNQIPTKDKKYIVVDTTARWKITDPLVFIQTVQHERGARTRLDAILDGVTRDIISSSELVEVVRNSNDIFTTIQDKKDQMKQKRDAGGSVVEDEEVTGELAKVTMGREKLSQMIVERAKSELTPLGISLIDVQLKRITYESSVQQKVYSRMISERQRIAEKIRSIGKGEKAKIEGKTQKDLQLIESQSYRTVQEIKGKAQGEAIAIYAKSLKRNPDFYSFTRTLDAYKKSIKKDSNFLLSTDSKFWKVLNDGR